LPRDTTYLIISTINIYIAEIIHQTQSTPTAAANIGGIKMISNSSLTNMAAVLIMAIANFIFSMMQKNPTPDRNQIAKIA
jgi:hypothetical protein